jgi:Pre-mRNA-splicing factor SF3a complex subunit 2 (Prp11)
MLFWTRTGLISLVRPGKYDYEFGFALPPMKTPDKNFQYMMVAAEPYQTCGFKLQAREMDAPYQTCGFKLQAREMDRKAPLYRRVFEIQNFSN